jgi:cell division protein FtsI (penicillin-binding protein 3)
MNYRPKNNKPKLSNKDASMRENVIGFFVVFVGVIFMTRLFYLQVIKHDDYDKIAKSQHERKYIIPAKRGTIFFSDNNNKTVPAVLNSSVFSLYADPKEVKDPEAVANKITNLIGGNKADYKSELEREDTRYTVLAPRLSLEQANKIKDQDDLKGLGLTEVPQRSYPEGSVGSQLLGFVNSEGEGQYGVEGYFNDQLSGKDGVRRTVASASGVPLTIINDDKDSLTSAEDGASVYLTIDRTVQLELENVLKKTVEDASADSASAIIMNPNNGQVVAIGNYPTYNPSEYYKAEDASIFLNKAVSDGTEVGSVIKTLTMAAGMDLGVINKDSTYNNTNYVQIEDRTISNATKTHLGSTTMTEVLQNSLNTGVVYVESQMGGGSINAQARNNLYTYFHDKYGFGELTGIEQAGEAQGILYKPDDQEGNNVRYSNMAFGQGFTSSLVQGATAFSAVINGELFTNLKWSVKSNSITEKNR